MHPMYREAHLRRKMGPVIVNKNSSQDRLIEELQGKLGIGRSERRRKQSDDWLTEGVIVTSKPQRYRPEGAASEVDKVGFSELDSFSKFSFYRFFHLFCFSAHFLCLLLSVCLLSLDHNSPRVACPCEEGAPTSLSPYFSSPPCYRRT